jgi:REP element-mobilizing transposase RayT
MTEKLDYQPSYRRNLPHIQPPGATLFITFRLAGTLPAAALERLQAQLEEAKRQTAKIEDETKRARAAYRLQRRHFGRWDAYLDRAASGPTWLGDKQIAQIVARAIHHYDDDRYETDVYCIMPNHVHLVLRPAHDDRGHPYALSRIMHGIKSYSATKANESLGRKGTFWQDESYDHIVRDEKEWQRIVDYVLNNPVKAGLVEQWQDWPWTYLRESH